MPLTSCARSVVGRPTSCRGRDGLDPLDQFRLPSGRDQARLTDAREERHTAPITFASKRDAEDRLATVRAGVVRGTWRAPELGAVTLADYTASLFAVRASPRPEATPWGDS